MDDALKRAVSDIVGGEVRDFHAVSGGCINQAYRIERADGERFFVKSNSGSSAMLVAEAESLAAIAATQAVRVPNVIGWHDSCSCLVLQWVQPGAKNSVSQQALGRALAQLHKAPVGNRFGFKCDNFLGETAQPNPFSRNWVQFWAVNRVEHQLKLARANGYDDRELHSYGQRLIGRLSDLLDAPAEAPALLHGDLWSGNWLADSSGTPFLIDPAAYHGHREAEFGMMTLFGDFTDAFYRAYDEVYPLAKGWENRAAVYRLYHLLNHLNLFGKSYLGQCVSLMRSLTR